MQVFVPIPDPDAEIRERIHSHVASVQSQSYRTIEKLVEIAWRTGRVPAMPRVLSLQQILDAAYETWLEREDSR